MTLVVMAAGLGSRYGGLKQLEPVGPSGEFIIDYSVYDAITAGFDKVVFIIKEENLAVFKETVGDKIESRITVEYAFQDIKDIPKLPNDIIIPKDRTKPWGTGHAVLAAKSKITDNFVVINADDFYGRESYMQTAEFFATNPEGKLPNYCMSGFVLKNTLTENGHVSRAVCTTDKDYVLESITERTKIMRVDGDVAYYEEETGWTKLSEDSVVSMNFWGFDIGFLDYLESGFRDFFISNKDDLGKCEYYLPTAVKQAMDTNKVAVKVLPTNTKWYGITYREDKESVVNHIADQVKTGVYPNKLWN